MVTHILKQRYLMIPVLEKTRIKQLIQFQMKSLSIIVEFYYKYNLFTTIIIKIYLKIRIIKYFCNSVDIPFLILDIPLDFRDIEPES